LITLSHDFTLSHSAFILSRIVIASKSYRSEHIKPVIATYSYRSDVILSHPHLLLVYFGGNVFKSKYNIIQKKERKKKRKNILENNRKSFRQGV
jgi:hypothetical protein